MCRRTAFAFIRLCGVCSANRRMLSVWSRYFKEKYIRNHTLTWTCIHSGSQRITSGTLAWQTLNKQLFDIRSRTPQSRMPCSHSRTDMDAHLDPVHFFIQKISSKFTFCFFKIFLKVPCNFFKIFRNFPAHRINFFNLFTISVKNLPIFPKISSLFSKFNQKFFEITLKFLRLRKTFSKFSSGVLKIIFVKNIRKLNIFSTFSLNPNKMFSRVHTYCHLPRIDENKYSPRISTRNN